MGTLLIYLLKTGLLFLFFYLFNRLFLANETFHKFNRIVWLLVLPVSLLLPLCVFGSFDLFGWLGFVEKDAPALVIPEGMTYSVLETEDNVTSSLARVVTWIGIVYCLGILVCLICYAVCYLKLFMHLRAGGRNNKAEPFRALLSECNRLVGVKRKVRLIVHSKEMAPFSWMRYIMVSEKDMNEDGREILIHELSHIRHGHSLDLILMDLLIVFQWFNPAVWLMKQSVQQVHEFQADDSVLRAGVNAKQYQLLLIKKAVGIRRYSMVNSFNHSKLKKRITMMWKKKSSKWAFAKCIYALPLAFVAVSAFAAPEISGRLTEISSVKDIQISLQQNIKPVTPPVPVPVPPPAVPVAESIAQSGQDSLVSLAVVETKPLFANGKDENEFSRWVFEHIKYPAEAKTKRIQGRVVASFVLNHEGNVTEVQILRGVHPLLDAEAIRVLESSPKWERPGTVKGKKVNVKYNFPLNFSLKKDKEDEASVKQSTNPEDIGLEPAIFANGKGENEFVRWVMLNVKYPEDAKNEGAKGRLLVSYELSKEGTIDQVEIIGEVHSSIEAEVLRVVKSSPKWEKPAMKEGVPVNVSYVMPLIFSLRGNDRDSAKTIQNLKDLKKLQVLDGFIIVGDSNQSEVKHDDTKIPKDVLVFVDGKEAKDLQELDPDDIESIEVLKGEPAVQKYGEKARKGVIIVKLK